MKTALNRVERLVRRVGPHPVLLGRTVWHGVSERRHQARLRSTYDQAVASPPAGARLELFELRVPPRGSLPDALSAAADRIVEEAEAALRHEVDYFGSGRVSLGEEIDWQRDFISGHRWPEDYYADVRVTSLSDASDAKVPWELSRCHHLLTLARAACLEGDERYAAELEAQLRHWIAANPPGRGINWTTSMEVALRAVNWVWAAATLEGFRPLGEETREQLTRSLQVHARHVRANLEGSPYLRGNHYLADIFGLLVIGAVVLDDPDAAGWLEFGHAQLEREIVAQTFADGVSFEASLPYHGLVLEMLLLARHVAAGAGRPLSPAYDRRLRDMLTVLRSVRHPDGRLPQLGDSDSGRVLPEGFERPPRADNLRDLGAAVLDAPEEAHGADPEVAWSLGVDAWERLARAERPAEAPVRTAFSSAGIYVLSGGGAHVVARASDVGQNGTGGHAHNDMLSFELSYGAPIVVDPGTFSYTGDPAARNELRSTAAHNTVRIDGSEIHPIVPEQIFQLIQFARPSVERWEVDGSRMLLAASHDGYRRIGRGVVHRRTFELDRESGELEVRDELIGEGGPHLAESYLHLPPGATAEKDGEGGLVIANGAARARLTLLGAGAELAIESGWVSDRYGVRERGPVVVLRLRATLPASFGWRLAPIRVPDRAADPRAVGQVP